MIDTNQAVEQLKKAQKEQAKAIDAAKIANDLAIKTLLKNDLSQEDLKKIQKFQSEFNLVIAEAKKGVDVRDKVQALVKKYK